MRLFHSWPLWLPAAGLLLACSRQPQASLASRFSAAPPAIDGQATDWTDSLRYDPASKLQYQLLNDTRTVYVRLKAADATTQARLLRLGFVVWLDTTGRHQQQFGVRFPLPDRMAAALPRPGEASNEQVDRRTRMRLILGSLHEMELLHYKGSSEPTLTDTQSPLGVKLAVGIDDQENLIYELAVPLRLLYHRLPNLTSGAHAVVGLTLAGNTWHAPTGSGEGMEGNRGASMGGGMRGGGGGMRGGGMRGGGYGGGYGGGGGRYAGGAAGTPLSFKTAFQLSGK